MCGIIINPSQGVCNDRLVSELSRHGTGRVGGIPRCGESLAGAKPQSEEQISRSAIVWYSAYTIGIALLVIAVGVAVILLCTLLFIAR